MIETVVELLVRLGVNRADAILVDLVLLLLLSRLLLVVLVEVMTRVVIVGVVLVVVGLLQLVRRVLADSRDDW